MGCLTHHCGLPITALQICLTQLCGWPIINLVSISRFMCRTHVMLCPFVSAFCDRQEEVSQDRQLSNLYFQSAVESNSSNSMWGGAQCLGWAYGTKPSRLQAQADSQMRACLFPKRVTAAATPNAVTTLLVPAYRGNPPQPQPFAPFPYLPAPPHYPHPLPTVMVLIPQTS